MEDFAKCNGVGCRVKYKCDRFPITNKLLEPYYLEPPLEVKDDVLICKMFWDENSNRVYNSIKEIFDSGN